jgi:ubiquinol-cytochrome c reductase iron-sulfur subunit
LFWLPEHVRIWHLSTTTHTQGIHGKIGAHHDDVNRRDFLFVATGAVGAAGAALVAWPLINQMNPDASVKALASVEVDLSPIVEGQAITIKWRGNPVLIRNRSAAEIDAAKAVPLSDLKDPIARNANVKDGEPASEENRVVGGKDGTTANYLVMMGVCTHLGCIPEANKGDYGIVEGNSTGGWLCPCHGSHYDTAGRIRKGPAPENLMIPKYSYIADKKILIG